MYDPPEKLHDPLPKKINWNTDRFEYVKDKYQINTRFAANRNLFIPKTGQSSIQYRGVHAWNGLSGDARYYSLEKFKKYVAGIVCNQYILVYIYIFFYFLSLYFDFLHFSSYSA